jgi:ribosomal protein S24E
MKIEIISRKENPLLARREVDFEVQDPSTPNRMDARNQIATLLKVTPERVYILKLKTRNGTQRTVGRAHIYDTVERAQRVEKRHIIARNNPVKEEKEEREEVG